LKNLTDFALKEKYNLIQLVVDILAEIDSLIDWKSFCIIFESVYFNIKVSLGRPEDGLIMMLKVLVLQL
jgi:hypothetical protein